MRERQRELAEDADVVIEGRDIGTVVAPDAEVKVYLHADRRCAPAGGWPNGPTSGPTRSPPTCARRDKSDAARMQPAEDADADRHDRALRSRRSSTGSRQLVRERAPA